MYFPSVSIFLRTNVFATPFFWAISSHTRHLLFTMSVRNGYSANFKWGKKMAKMYPIHHKKRPSGEAKNQIYYTNLLSCRMIILRKPFLQSWYFRFRIKTDSHSWFGHLKLFRRWWSRHQIGWNSQGPIATEVMRRIGSSRRWELKSRFWKAFDLIFQSSNTKNWRTFKIEKLFTQCCIQSDLCCSGYNWDVLPFCGYPKELFSVVHAFTGSDCKAFTSVLMGTLSQEEKLLRENQDFPPLYVKHIQRIPGKCKYIYF